MCEDIYEVDAYIKSQAEAILQKRREQHEYRLMCLRAHLCPSCGSALKDVSSIWSRLSFHSIETWQCINCLKRFHC